MSGLIISRSVHKNFLHWKNACDNPLYAASISRNAVRVQLPRIAGSFPHSIGKANVKIEYLGKARVSAQEKRAIVALVFAGNSVQSCTGFNRNEKKEIESIRIARTDLKPGERNLLVQASDNCNCGGTGNCSFWILRERPDGFDTLLKTFMVQSFAVEPSSSNGYKDVITYAHGSASYGELALYQFDGKQYHKTRCARRGVQAAR